MTIKRLECQSEYDQRHTFRLTVMAETINLFFLSLLTFHRMFEAMNNKLTKKSFKCYVNIQIAEVLSCLPLSKYRSLILYSIEYWKRSTIGHYIAILSASFNSNLRDKRSKILIDQLVFFKGKSFVSLSRMIKKKNM